MPVEFNPFTPEFRADPWTTCRELREHDRFHHNDLLNITVLSHYGDVDFVLHDPRFSSDPRTHENFVMPQDGEFAVTMLSADPPDHTRLRTLVNKAFTPRRVEALRPRIQQIADELIDRAAERGEMDVISELAYPLPITVIAELLGVPSEDQDKFREWSGPIAAGLDPIPSPDPALQDKLVESQEALGNYFTDIAAKRRAEPRDDMISALIAVEQEGDRLSENELVGMFILLLVAGHETTVNLIGNGLHALLNNRPQLERLATEPGVARTAIEELLRYDGPVQLTARHPREDVDLDGHLLPNGREVMVLLGAANRDPSAFDEPDTLRLDRQPNAHLTFGQGIHFCVGAPLARVEGQVALTTLARRFPGIELSEKPEYRETIVLRGLKSLRVSL